MTRDPAQAGAEDVLEQLHAAVRGVDALPVAARVDTFEQVNDGIARELARLDEV
ncbi:MAG: hypothetical protein KG028_08440 [Actinobacteria bacterium]|nr:hypothetical protein [Actinomycetota bacterium]